MKVWPPCRLCCLPGSRSLVGATIDTELQPPRLPRATTRLPPPSPPGCADPWPDAPDKGAAARSDGPADWRRRRRQRRAGQPPRLCWLLVVGPCCPCRARPSSACSSGGSSSCSPCCAAWHGGPGGGARARPRVRAARPGRPPSGVQPPEWLAAAAAAAPDGSAAAVCARIPSARGAPCGRTGPGGHAGHAAADGARPRRGAGTRRVPPPRWGILPWQHAAPAHRAARWDLPPCSRAPSLPCYLAAPSCPAPPLRTPFPPAPVPGLAPPGFAPQPVAPPAGTAPLYGTPQYHAWLRQQQVAASQRMGPAPPPPPPARAATAVKWEAPAMPQAYSQVGVGGGTACACTLGARHAPRRAHLLRAVVAVVWRVLGQQEGVQGAPAAARLGVFAQTPLAARKATPQCAHLLAAPNACSPQNVLPFTRLLHALPFACLLARCRSRRLVAA